ncbi:hypothetical protein [Paeniglutamicibacter sp. NPDC091659]|uniref:hypothetical protein n=1 Tax=Paeniglutamicibacter sp. NPDC091659 TaxID=3364389 RepID=UPI0037F3D1AB
MRFIGSATAGSHAMPWGMRTAPRTLPSMAGLSAAETAASQRCAPRSGNGASA